MKKVSIIIASLFILSSCEKIIDYDLPDPGTKLAMQSFFTQGDSIGVLVSESSYSLDPASPKAGDDYLVYLYENNILKDTLTPRFYTTAYNNYGLARTDVYKYYSDFIPQIGNTYKIEAAKTGLTTITASTNLPTPPQVNLLSGDTATGEYAIEIVDNALPDDTYLLKLIAKYNSPSSDFQYSYFLYNDPSVQSLQQQNDNPFDSDPQTYTSEAYVSGEFFNNGRKVFNFTSDYYFYGGNNAELSFEVIKITDDYFKFKISVAAFANYIELFSEPAQIYSNVENGYGILGGGGKASVKLENK